jgi:hypothetical protein
MAKSNTSSVKMDSGVKTAFFANVSQKAEKGYKQNQHEKGEVNARKAPKSAEAKKKAKAKAKAAKASRKKNK